MLKLKRFNKATAALVSGALVSIIGGVVVVEPAVLDSIQVLLTTALVYFVPNGE